MNELPKRLLFPAKISEPFFPSIALPFELFDRHSLLDVPSFEAVFFHGAAVIVIFQNFLSVRTEKKIDEQNRGVRVRRLRRQSGAARARRHDLHRHPCDRRAFCRRDQRVIAKNRRRRFDFAGDDHVVERLRG